MADDRRGSTATGDGNGEHMMIEKLMVGAVALALTGASATALAQSHGGGGWHGGGGGGNWHGGGGNWHGGGGNRHGGGNWHGGGWHGGGWRGGIFIGAPFFHAGWAVLLHPYYDPYYYYPSSSYYYSTYPNAVYLDSPAGDVQSYPQPATRPALPADRPVLLPGCRLLPGGKVVREGLAPRRSVGSAARAIAGACRFCPSSAVDCLCGAGSLRW